MRNRPRLLTLKKLPVTSREQQVGGSGGNGRLFVWPTLKKSNGVSAVKQKAELQLHFPLKDNYWVNTCVCVTPVWTLQSPDLLSFCSDSCRRKTFAWTVLHPVLHVHCDARNGFKKSISTVSAGKRETLGSSVAMEKEGLVLHSFWKHTTRRLMWVCAYAQSPSSALFSMNIAFLFKPHYHSSKLTLFVGLLLSICIPYWSIWFFPFWQRERQRPHWHTMILLFTAGFFHLAETNTESFSSLV